MVLASRCYIKDPDLASFFVVLDNCRKEVFYMESKDNKLNQDNMLIASVKELKSVRTLAFCGLMAALAIVLSLIATIEVGPYIRIGFSELPNRLVDAMFGPFVGGLFGGALDVLKFIIKPTGPFFFGFTLDAILGGVIFGCLNYRHHPSIWRVLIANLLIKLIVNCGFNTYWLTILYGKAFFVILPARLLKNAIMLPIDTAIQFFCLKFTRPILLNLGFIKADKLVSAKDKSE